MSKLIRMSLPLAVALALALAVPAVASADGQVFCVNARTCPAKGIDMEGDLQDALDGAFLAPGADTVLIGDKGTPYVGPFSYDHPNLTGDAIEILASGPGRPLLTSPNPGAVLTLRNADQMEGIDVRLTTSNQTGLALAEGEVHDMKIVNAAQGGFGQTGVEVVGNSTLGGVTAEVEGEAVDHRSGPLMALGLSLRGRDAALRVGGGTVFLGGSRLEAVTDPLLVTGGRLSVSRSVAVTTGRDRSGAEIFGSGSMALDHVTLARRAPGSTTGRAIVMHGVNASGVQLHAVALAGYAGGLQRKLVAGQVMPLLITDSVWDPSQDDLASGAAFTGAANGSVEPALVDLAGGDLRPRAGSLLVDRDRENPDLYSDLDEIRAVDGDGDGLVLADAGAFEYRRQPPVIESASVPETVSPGASFEVAGAAVDPDGDAVSLSWDFGDGDGVEGPRASHSFATAGSRTVTLTARDETGLTATRQLVVAVVDRTGGGTSANDRTAPSLLARLSRSRVRVRRAGGLSLKLALSEPASVRVTFKRRVRGRRAAVRGAIVRSLPAGTSRLRLARSLRRLGVLRRGRYVVTVVATDPAGNRSPARNLALTLKRR